MENPPIIKIYHNLEKLGGFYMPKNGKYFDLSSVSTIQDLKRQYKELIKKFHPDLGGSNQQMAEINNEYDKVFDQVKKGSTWKKDQNATVDDGFREILVKVIHIPDITIEVCGTWLWISGNTKSFKDIIKSAGFHWAIKKGMWYWHSPEDTPIKRRSNTPMEKIREMYGSQVLENQPFTAIHN